MTHWLGYVLGDAIAIASKEQIIKATVFNGASNGIFWCQDISNRCWSRVMNFIPMGWWRRTGLLKYARRLKWREVWSREKIDSQFNLWMAKWLEWLAGWLDTPPVCFESGGSLTLLLSCHLPVPPEWQEGEGCTNLGIASPAFHQIRGCLSFRQLTVRLRLSWKLILKTERKVICLKVWSWTSGYICIEELFLAGEL